MDFRRVEGIFLVVFLLLNMFLFYIYFEGKQDQDSISRGSITENLEERLHSESIKISEPLSSKKEEGYYISAEEVDLVDLATKTLTNQEWHVNNNQLKSTLMNQSQVYLTNADDLEKVTTFINNPKMVIQGSEYILNATETKAMKHYIYNQSWEGIPFNDETSRLDIEVVSEDFESGAVIGYEQRMIGNIDPLREKQTLISAREAIISLYTNNRLQPGTTIKGIDLGYTRIFTVRGKNVYIPAWFVTLETSKEMRQTERVNAFTSAVISSGVSEVTH